MIERKNLLIKTFSADSEEKIDRLVNDFSTNGDNVVRATHTHVSYTNEAANVFYDYILFYYKKETETKQIAKEEMMDCPNCGAEIPKSFDFHMKCGWKKNE